MVGGAGGAASSLQVQELAVSVSDQVQLLAESSTLSDHSQEDELDTTVTVTSYTVQVACMNMQNAEVSVFG